MTFSGQLLCLLLLSNVLLRVFTNKVGVLPKVFNIADVFLVAWLFAISLRYQAVSMDRPRFGTRLLLFNLVLLLGALFNLTYCHPPAALSQVIMWNEPLLLFLALWRLPLREHEANRFKVWLVRLLALELALGVLQIPIYIVTGQTESIIGTFFGNAEQYQGFIMIAVFYLLSRQYLEPGKRIRLAVGTALILCLIVLIDNKASWLGVLVSILVVYSVQQNSFVLWLLRPRHLAPIAICFAAGITAAIYFSPSIGKVSGVVEAFQEGKLRDLGKVKAFDDILHAYGSHSHMALVGSGPGNFYSRSGTQFYALGLNLGNPEKIKQAAGRTSHSMGGVISLTTRQPFYAQYYYERDIRYIGSAQVDSPFSSYAALVGETGVLGTILYLSIYGTVLRRLKACIQLYREHKPEFYPLVIAAIGLLTYTLTDAIYSGWLETGRMTTIAWSLAALALRFAPSAASETIVTEEAVDENAAISRPVFA